MDTTFAHRRLELARHLAERGIGDHRVIEAIAKVPRERFVTPELVDHAYQDRPLPIGGGQTISQPYIVAMMAQAAAPAAGDRVLEIGTGSGYGAAVLAELAAEVHTVERLPELAAEAEARLGALGYAKVHVHVGDGSKGWPAAAPYQAVVVTAGGPRVPPSLVAQLADGGRLVIPVGGSFEQRLLRVTRAGARTLVDDLGPVQFVPLVGGEAWDGAGA